MTKTAGLSIPTASAARAPGASAPAAPASTPAAPTPSARSGRWLLLTLCLANFMAALDLFVVNVALQGIGTHFGGSLANVSWVLSGYAIVFGALLIPAGRAADRFGRKGTFMLGVILFTVASAACALSPTLWALVTFRCVQAAGAAILVPSSLGLVLTTTPPDRVLRGVRIWAVSSAVAGTAGPVAGGLLAQADWRLIFLINLPIGLVTLASAARHIPTLARAAGAHVPSPVATTLMIITIGALSLGVVKGQDWGWADRRVLLSWAVALLAGAAFAAVNRRAATPVIDLALFRERVFSGANLAMVFASIALAMQLLGLSLFLQQSWHWSAIAAGAGLAPAPLATFVTARVTPRLAPRLRPATAATIGFLVIAAGQVLISLSLGGTHGHDYAVAVLPGWIISGVGGGLAVPAVTGLATIDLPSHASATGSAVLQMARQLGSVLGTSVLVAILGTAVATGTATAFLHAWWVSVACYVTAAGVAAWLRRRLRLLPTPPASWAPPGRS
jgi:EmrB/QacA subfamily drug resistance transporter